MKGIPNSPFPMAPPAAPASCGGQAEDNFARPGYQLSPFVNGFHRSPAGAVPRVGSRLTADDWLGTIKVRVGWGRQRYRIAPGLYCLGHPGPDSPVVVTANYKLSFDTVRAAVAGEDLWLLVLDTRGVNVWCAAGKKNFSTDEVARRVRESGLAQVVNHRQLILPQLGAPGVAGQLLKKRCDFSPIWGPVRAKDLPEFIRRRYQATPAMRQLTFTLAERLVLIPLEVSLFLKTALLAIPILFLLSGFGPNFFSLAAAWSRGCTALAALAIGMVAGAVVVPALLPWLPGRAFYLKGMVTGFLGGLLFFLNGKTGPGLQTLALFLWTMVVSSYTAMNFTGATPFTSPSGVEKEMRQGIPLQLGGALLALLFWVWRRAA